MGWKLVEVPDDDSALTDAELIGIRVILAHSMGEPQDERNVYFRAYEKMNEAAEKALKERIGRREDEQKRTRRLGILLRYMVESIGLKQRPAHKRTEGRSRTSSHFR